jgi:hypothetical protein
MQYLPEKPTERQVDDALRGWGQNLMNYLAAHPKSIQKNEGEIASLVVAFRFDGKPFFYKERISKYQGKVVRDDGQSVRWALSDQGAGLLYSGSCRNFIRVDGQRTIEVTPSEALSLQKLGEEARSAKISTASDLGAIALKLEKRLTDINKSHATDPNIGDDIGPPFQLATLPENSSRWTTTFQNPCP